MEKSALLRGPTVLWWRRDRGPKTPRATAGAAALPTMDPSAPLIELRSVVKTYSLGETTVNALNDVSVRFSKGEFVAIWGPSGSGKTTLLNLVGLIDKPSGGTLHLGGHELNDFDEPTAASLRNHLIGFIFQGFNLVPVLSAMENVMLPLQIQGMGKRAARDRAMELIDEVGLRDWADSLPDRMSGGQRQRIAIARALVTRPKIVVADEPTANLDSDNSQRVMELMRELNRKHGAAFVFSTHDRRILDHVDRRIELRDGCLAEGGR